MKIRSVEPRDFDAIAALTNRYIRETAIHFGETPVMAMELQREWQSQQGRYPFLVAIDGGNETSGAPPIATPAAPSATSSAAPIATPAPAPTMPPATLSAMHFTASPPIPGERLLGYAKAGPWRTREAYRATAEVGIYIDPAAQGRGIGRALYESLVAECRRAGFHALIGSITMPNEASVRLHERLGFVRIGVFPEVGRKFDRWHDVGFWQLLL